MSTTGTPAVPWPALVRLLWRQPQLIAEHAAAYAALAGDEGAEALSAWLRALLLRLAAVACLVVAATLGGVALLLAAALPALDAGWRWALVVVPLLPLLPAAWAGWRAAQPPAAAFAGLRAQLAQDGEAWQAWRHGSPR